MNLSKKQILAAVGFVILLIAIPATLYLVRQQQILKSRADFTTVAEFVDSAGNPITQTSSSSARLRIRRVAASPSASPSPSPSPTPTSTPSATPIGSSLCADGTNDQVYSSTMVRCDGAAASADSALCASGSHVCSVSEFIVRGGGGSTNPGGNKPAFLSDKYSTQEWCENNSRSNLIPGGNQTTASCPSCTFKYSYDSAACGTGSSGWFANGGGSLDAVLCCSP